MFFEVIVGDCIPVGTGGCRLLAALRLSLAEGGTGVSCPSSALLLRVGVEAVMIAVHSNLSSEDDGVYSCRLLVRLLRILLYFHRSIVVQ